MQLANSSHRFRYIAFFEHEILGAFSPKPCESEKIYEMHGFLFAEGFPGKQEEAVLLSFQLKCSSNIDSIHYLGLTNSFHQVPRDIHTLPVKEPIPSI
jgi:hypothetical protein